MLALLKMDTTAPRSKKAKFSDPFYFRPPVLFILSPPDQIAKSVRALKLVSVPVRAYYVG